MKATACPRCDATGIWWGDKPCKLCAGLGEVDEDVASEYVHSYEAERLEAEKDARGKGGK